MLNTARHERTFSAILRIFAFVYVLAGLSFLVATPVLFNVLNQLGALVIPAAPPLSLPSEKFWSVLTFSLMMTLVYLSWTASVNLREKRSCVIAILISKFISTAGFLVFYYQSGYTVAYLAGAIVDGTIFLIHYLFYRKVFHARLIS